jgi:hypothetical protein
MALTDLSRCSAAARHRGDPLAGSAPVAARWLLVEHPGPWAKAPLDTPPMAGRAGQEIEAVSASYGGKVLLIRRQGRRQADGGDPAWYAVDTVRGTWVRGTWRTAEDLLAAAHALGPALSVSDEDADPMVLVCTHGTRDACCAVRGRPIAARLARERPGDVWECTHLGGHRFSGTLLVLPDGACYGMLDTDDAAEVVSGHLAGRVTASHLRGLTRYEPEVQAAVAAVLREYGPTGSTDAEAGLVTPGRAGMPTRVEVLGHGPVPEIVVVDVVREELPEAPLSCGAGPKPHVAYRTTLSLPA